MPPKLPHECEQCDLIARELQFAYWRLELLRERVEFLVNQRDARTLAVDTSQAPKDTEDPFGR